MKFIDFKSLSNIYIAVRHAGDEDQVIVTVHILFIITHYHLRHRRNHHNYHYYCRCFWRLSGLLMFLLFILVVPCVTKQEMFRASLIHRIKWHLAGNKRVEILRRAVSECSKIPIIWIKWRVFHVLCFISNNFSSSSAIMSPSCN